MPGSPSLLALTGQSSEADARALPSDYPHASGYPHDGLGN